MKPAVHERSAVTTFLFSDIEGSTRLWEHEPERMRVALARHDALARAAVETHNGTVVKMTGDGMHAVFEDAVDGIGAAVGLQQTLADPEATRGLALHVRCGLHAGIVERRDNDYFGVAVNRAARIMGAAHGGQILLSQAVATLARERLPAGIVLRDLGAVRLRDLASAERVYQVLHPQLRRDFPPLRSLEATPNNLPQQVTSFIGRERELAEVAGLLRKCRLLTLLGAGGLGKTRLSLQVAAEAMDDYPDGVWFVELAPVADTRLVPQAVASVLGVKEESGRPVIEAVVKHVGDRKLLLILDNCEHLVDACADIAMNLLRAGPDVKLVASSREPLRIGGETAYPVPALAVPDSGSAIALAALSQYESVRLFNDRAVAAHPSFLLTQQNAAAVTDICQRLDGIPLAIELAAARVRTLSVDKIAERLHDRFRLLTGGDRTATPRQQTLRASIDWSYDLLSGQERALLRRLAVFAGGWTLDAAEAVGSGGDLDETDVLDVLSRLVEKSLAERDAEGERYRLLETVREYAQERLRESGGETGARTRHLMHFVGFVEIARTGLVGPDQGKWLSRIDLERENLLAAHAWCDHADQGAEAGLRLIHAVQHYWINRGLLGLGRRVTSEALARAGAEARTPMRGWVLFDAGWLCCYMGRYDEAQTYLAECLDIARSAEDSERVAAVLQPLAMAALGRGDIVEARRYSEEALALAQALGKKRDILSALNALAQLHRVGGDLDAAEPLYRQVHQLAIDLDDPESIALCLLNLAMVAIGRRSGGPACAILLEVIAIVGEIGSRPAGQSVLEVCSGLGALLGEWECAVRFFGAAEVHAEKTGLRRDAADEAFLAPRVAQARAAVGSEAFAAAEAAGRALSYDIAMAQARAWLESRA